MADQVVIYHVTFKGAIYEANLLSGTYFAFTSGERFEARQRALTRAGIPFAAWVGEPASMDGEFGVQIASPLDPKDISVGVWMQKLADRPARDVFLDINSKLK